MKPSIPKGTRDFLPSQVAKRQFIFSKIKKVFQTYGYVPIETPVMENLSTLTGKYGDEGDQLLFKVLNNGDFLKNADAEILNNKDSKKLVPSIAKRGLRYDLTVPFARFVAMHQNNISFPFKRYQIQQVWRGDRPQKGRYQEFFQCDADVVGSESLMYEAELVKIFDDVFRNLNIKVKIKINNRKVLYGIAEACGIADQFVDMTVAIDKVDKIGKEGVVKDMVERGINEDTANKVLTFFDVTSLNNLEGLFENSPTGLKGIEELRTFHKYLDTTQTHNEIAFDISLARGLSYYTGCIVEVESKDVNIGSIGGGGRYDDLTSTFGLKNVSGVGISFGAARIFDVMEELNLFPKEIDQILKVLLIAFDETSHEFAFSLLSKLRDAGVSADLYPKPTKLGKQMKYANQINVPYTLLIGSEEISKETFALKNMETGEQSAYSLEQLIKALS
ncbi:MAG: histidine--tRNA ligase [Saprospiraceae bacterium]|nr:histidine--tRNA ligase [Bacteroidia bacterium]NNE15380.1 histidine--tRNA ligase [Saprospiraceae bacterium]NNL93429.1 histidine--tRNA ligase [Saprospiraceae bacterium]